MGMRAVACALVAAAIALVVLGVCDGGDSRDAQIGPHADTTSLDGDAIDASPGVSPNGRGPARAKRDAVGAAAGEPATAGAELCIVVRNEQRSLLIGARVHVVAADGHAFDARTDAQGEAVLALPAGRAVATVRREGYAPCELHVWLTGQGRETRSITLTPGISVDVRVVRDDDGTPIAGARVEIALGAAGRSGEPYRSGVAVDAGTTDSDGRTWLAGADPCTAQVLTATAPGLEHRVVFVWPDAGSAQVEVRLPIGGLLTGRVVDADDHPARATVQLFVGDPSLAPFWVGVATADCGDEGTFTFDGLPRDGLFDVRAYWTPDGKWPEAGCPSAALLGVRPSDAGVLEPHILRLPRPARITFALADDGVPSDEDGAESEIPDVSLVPLARDSATPTDDVVWEGPLSGAAFVGPGRWRATASATSRHPGGQADFEVAPGADVVVSIPRHETWPLLGRVVDRQGRGIADVRIEADRVASGEREVIISGTDGTFFKPHLRRGTWELSVTTHRGVAAPVIVEMPPADPPPAAAASARAASPPVTITVAEGAMFVMRFPDIARERRMHVRFDRRLPPGAPDDDGETPDGWGGEGYVEGHGHAPATWGPCAPGQWRVVARVVGFRPWVREFTVTDGTTQTVDVEGLDPGVAITGTVVDARGAPLIGAYVRLLDGWWDSTSQATRADGVFPPLAAPPGRATLEVTANEFADSRVEFDAVPGLAPLRLVVYRGGVAAIEVRRADGSRATGVPVLATWPDGTEMNRWFGEVPTTDARGVYRLNGAPGRYRVRIGDSVLMDVEIEDEATTTWAATVP